MKALVLDGISRDFGGLRALDNINLTVEMGERRGIIGPNGAGKTTLFHLISGVLTPSMGNIYLFGKNITQVPAYKRPSLGLGRTFQITKLFPKLSVLQNVLLGVVARDNARFSLARPAIFYPHLFTSAQRLLDMWDLWDKRDMRASSLGYGEQRQIEIILALAANPKVLLLDEPTAGLTASESKSVCSMVEALPRDITMLIIEHDIDSASKMVDRATVLNMGRVIADSSWQELRNDSEIQDIYLGVQRP